MTVKNHLTKIGLLIGLGLLSMGAAQADQLQEIMGRKELRCGTFSDVPPFAAPDAKTREMVGFDVDMCNAVAKRLGVTAKITPLSVEARVPEVKLGLLPGGGGTQRLPRVVGASRAKEIMLTGRQVRAEEAFRIGLADEVVAPEQLHERALALAAEVARGAVLAQAMVKRAVDEGIEGALADGLRLERQLFTDVFNTSDSQVGVASFLEHGPGKATFSGS